jgi:8-oxo-dGTP diphosphatase
MSNNNNGDKPRNPTPTIDMIIVENSNEKNRILLIKRGNDPFKGYLSLPGGFINYGEKAEDALRREAKEELSIKVEPIGILGVYSDPNRDPRGHIMSITFITKIIDGIIKSNYDAAKYIWVDLNSIEKMELAFDHLQIIKDFRRWQLNKDTFWSSK